MKRVFFFVFSEMLGIVNQRSGDTFRLAVDCMTDTGRAYTLYAAAEDEDGNRTQAAANVFVRR